MFILNRSPSFRHWLSRDSKVLNPQGWNLKRKCFPQELCNIECNYITKNIARILFSRNVIIFLLKIERNEIRQISDLFLLGFHLYVLAPIQKKRQEIKNEKRTLSCRNVGIAWEDEGWKFLCFHTPMGSKITRTWQGGVWFRNLFPPIKESFQLNLILCRELQQRTGENMF